MKTTPFAQVCRISGLAALLGLLAPSTAHADLLVTQSMFYLGRYGWVLLLIVVVVEVLGYWLVMRGFFNQQVKFWQSVLIVSLANFVSAVIGIAIPLSNAKGREVIIFLWVIGWPVTSLIEGFVYRLYKGDGHFTVSQRRATSFIVNAMSYLVLTAAVFYGK